MKIAAMEYEAALRAVCDEAVMAAAARGLNGVLGGPLITIAYETRERLRNLREAAVREYAAALEADEQQRIQEATRGW